MAGDSELTKKRILDNARILFSQKGFDATRSSDIAKKCGISQALIYYNFPSKKAILHEVMDRFLHQIVEMFAEVFAGHGEDGPVSTNWSPAELKQGMNVFMSHREEFTILITESLKVESSEISLLDFWDEINRGIRNELVVRRGFSLDHRDLQQSMVDVFLILIPTVFLLHHGFRLGGTE